MHPRCNRSSSVTCHRAKMKTACVTRKEGVGVRGGAGGRRETLAKNVFSLSTIFTNRRSLVFELLKMNNERDFVIYFWPWRTALVRSTASIPAKKGWGEWGVWFASRRDVYSCCRATEWAAEHKFKTNCKPFHSLVNCPLDIVTRCSQQKL